jgi:hypothetical protein
VLLRRYCRHALGVERGEPALDRGDDVARIGTEMQVHRHQHHDVTNDRRIGVDAFTQDLPERLPCRQLAENSVYSVERAEFAAQVACRQFARAPGAVNQRD